MGTLLDRQVLVILHRLSLTKGRGLRYKEIKALLGVSDSTVSFKLGLLQKHRLISPLAVITEDENFFVYVLTKKGEELVGQTNIQKLVRELDVSVPRRK